MHTPSRILEWQASCEHKFNLRTWYGLTVNNVNWVN